MLQLLQQGHWVQLLRTQLYCLLPDLPLRLYCLLMVKTLQPYCPMPQLQLGEERKSAPCLPGMRKGALPQWLLLGMVQADRLPSLQQTQKQQKPRKQQRQQ